MNSKVLSPESFLKLLQDMKEVVSRKLVPIAKVSKASYAQFNKNPDNLKVLNDPLRILRENNPRTVEVSILQQIGNNVRECDHSLAIFCSRIIQLFDLSISSLTERMFLPTFLTLRASLETIACFFLAQNQTLTSLEKISQKDFDYEEIDIAMEPLMRFISGMRSNLVEYFYNANFTEYSPDPNGGDLKARSIMSGIDFLDKRITNARILYEFFCEFAHPNIGASLAVIKKTIQKIDNYGVIWIEKDYSENLSPEISVELLSGYGRMFYTFKTVLDFFGSIFDLSQNLKSKTLLVVQSFIRRQKITCKVDYSPYDQCFCGSEIKFKFCCKKTS